MTGIGSQQVSWQQVHLFVLPLLDAVGNTWPLLGTPAWCELADDDPVKLAALFDAARHWALRLECRQEALAEASRDVSAAADWSVIATAILARRNSAYIPRAAS